MKKMLMIGMITTLMMSFSAMANAQVVKDANGERHYVPVADDRYAFYHPKTPAEVLQITEEEWNAMVGGGGIDSNANN